MLLQMKSKLNSPQIMSKFYDNTNANINADNL